MHGGVALAIVARHRIDHRARFLRRRGGIEIMPAGLDAGKVGAVVHALNHASTRRVWDSIKLCDAGERSLGGIDQRLIVTQRFGDKRLEKQPLGLRRGQATGGEIE